jgi:hypothetical protein
MPSPLAESGCYPGQSRYTETLMEVIVNQAATLYEKMVKDFANQTITTAVESSTALLPSIEYSDEHTTDTQVLAYRHISHNYIYDR